MKCPVCGAGGEQVVRESDRLRCKSCGAVGRAGLGVFWKSVIGAFAGAAVASLVLYAITPDDVSSAVRAGALGGVIGGTVGTVVSRGRRFTAVGKSRGAVE